MEAEKKGFQRIFFFFFYCANAAVKSKEAEHAAISRANEIQPQ